MDFSQFGDVSPEIQDAIMQSASANGVDPRLLASIARQESEFNPNVYSSKGAGGLYQLMPDTAQELGVSDVTNPYQSAMGGGKYIAQQLRRYNGNINKALAAYNAGPGNVDSWIENGWDGDPDKIPFDETRNYVKSIGSSFNGNVPVGYTQQNGSAPINLKAMFSMDDPNEQIDFAKVMNIINAPKQSVSANADDALRSQLVRQASHMARGRLASPFYAQSDKALMQSAISQAQEEAKLNNQAIQLTGAGQLAQMIAQSKNSSNAGMLASLGQMFGVKLDPMANRYINQNDMAKMALQFARQDQQIANQQAYQASEAEKQRDFQREMASTKGSQGGGSGGSRGSSSSSMRASDKDAEELADKFTAQLNDLSDKDGFSQQDVDDLNLAYRYLVERASSMEATPYAMSRLKAATNDYNYAINHMQNSASGNKLNYLASAENVKRLKAIEDARKKAEQKG